MNLVLNFIFFILSCAYIFWTNDCRSDFFHPTQFENHLYIYKAISYLIIIFLGQFVLKIIKGIKKKESFYINFLTAFIPIVIVHFIIFFLTNKADFNWYNWDSNSTVEAAVQFDYKCWHHFFTVVYFIIAYLIFPFKSGVIVFQMLFFAFVISYIYAKISNIHNFKFKWLMLLPCFSFPILRMNIQPIRCCVYYVFLILLFAIIYFVIKRAKGLKLWEGIILSVYFSILCAWRSENLIFLIFVPIFYLFCGNFSKLKYITFLFVFYGFSMFFIFNPHINAKITYSLIPFKRPIAAIIRTDFVSDNKQKDIETISKLFDYDLLKNCELTSAIHEEPKPNSEEHIKEYIKDYILTSIKLIFMNFKTFLKDRVDFSENFTYVNMLHDKSYDERDMDSIEEKTLSFLGMLNFYYWLGPLARVVYSPVIPFFIVFFSLIYFIIRRNTALIIVTLLSLINAIISYLTSAEMFFHYYIQVYFLGYYILYFAIAIVIEKIYNRKYGKDS